MSKNTSGSGSSVFSIKKAPSATNFTFLHPAFFNTFSVRVSLAKIKSKLFKSSILLGERSSCPTEAPHKMSFLPAFLMEKSELPLAEKFLENKTVGFNFSPLVAKKNPKAKQAVHQLIEHILHTTEYNTALVPHVIMNGNNDVETLQEILDKFKNNQRVFMLSDGLNATEYKGYIARMRFFIGARTHATIAAYSTGVPTMVLGYSVKSKGIAKDIFGEEKLVLGIEEISDAEKLIAKFEEMKQEELMLKEIVRNKIPYIKEMAQKAKSYLAEIL